MGIIYLILALTVPLTDGSQGHGIAMAATAGVDQVFLEIHRSDTPLAMNDLDVESGYVLYRAGIVTEREGAVLELENVRDYAAVYVDGILCGSVTDARKMITLPVAPGSHTLQLYAQNIGRITYGPEILDNSKGLYGDITIDGEPVDGWTIIPLDVHGGGIGRLQFTDMTTVTEPAFFRGYFEVAEPAEVHLDLSGWGMGEVWVNGRYTGTFWEEEKQRSILLPAGSLKRGENEVVVFELKNNGVEKLSISNTPVFL